MSTRTPQGERRALSRRRPLLRTGAGLFVLTMLACGAQEATPGAEAPRSAASSTPTTTAPPPLDIRLDGGQGGINQAFHPAPVEVQACLDLVAAGENEKAAEVCARAHALEPANAAVRAANAKLQGE